MPSTMLVPFADSFNHAPEGSYASIVNFKFEREGKDQIGSYHLQKPNIDLSIIDDPALVITTKDRESYTTPLHPRLIYIENRLVTLSFYPETLSIVTLKAISFKKIR